MNHIKIGIFALLSSLLLITSVSVKASTFSFIGGAGDTLPGNWNPSPSAPGLAIGSGITIFDEAGEGIWLNGAADLLYTYTGKEAGSINAFLAPSTFFVTSATAPDSISNTSASSAGYLDFSFLGLGTCCGVAPGAFTNGSGNSGPNNGLSIAVAMINPSALYLMFGDGSGDADFDDMVVKVEAFDVSPVPVPAAVWLFGTALIGLAGFSKRREST